MKKNRLEAFSDGVIAIIITIMVLEIKVPHGALLADLKPLLPVFGSYVLSFLYIAVYWNNHHHLMMAISKVNGNVLWANVHLLFWLSLLPFASGWMGENHFGQWPVILYGVLLCMCGVAYSILMVAMQKVPGQNLHVLREINDFKKGVMSVLFELLGILVAFWFPMVSFAIYLLVGAWWLIPNRKIERLLSNSEAE